MKKVDDIEHVARFYAKAMQYFLEFLGISKIEIEERVVFDMDTSEGIPLLPSTPLFPNLFFGLQHPL